MPEHVLHCAIWYHLYNLTNLKNTHGGMLLLVKLQAKSLHKWYQIAQSVSYDLLKNGEKENSVITFFIVKVSVFQDPKVLAEKRW